MAYDLLITDAQILDGTGTPALSGHVAVQDGHIVAVGDVSGTATRTIHANGLALAPGFIDIHTHMDAQLLWDPLATVAYDLPAGARRFIQKATGIHYTIVNGQVLMEQGEHTGSYPGRVLRRPA